MSKHKEVHRYKVTRINPDGTKTEYYIEELPNGEKVEIHEKPKKQLVQE